MNSMKSADFILFTEKATNRDKKKDTGFNSYIKNCVTPNPEVFSFLSFLKISIDNCSKAKSLSLLLLLKQV